MMKKSLKILLAVAVSLGALAASAVLLPPLFAILLLGLWLFGVRALFRMVLPACATNGKRLLVGVLLAVALLPTLALVLMPAMLAGAHYSVRNPEYFQGSEINWGGAKRKNADYFHTYNCTLLEFDLSEEDFRKLASGKGWATQELKAPVQIQERARDRIAEFTSGEAPNPVPVTVRRGLAALYRQKNGGGYFLVFDRDSNRLYWSSSSH